MLFILLWGLVFVIPLVGSIEAPNLTPYPSGSFLAGLDNFALPLAMILLTWWWASRDSSLRLLYTAATTIVVTLAGNAALSLLYFGSPPEWLRIFWSTGERESVAAQAATMGRYSGIVNQPAEAGVAYSLAIICLLYIVNEPKKRFRSGLFLVCGSLIVIGGVLTASKVFLIGGLPLAAFMVLRESRGRGRAILLTVAATTSFVAVSSMGLLPEWTGSRMVSRLLGVEGMSTTRLLSAGRLGEGGTLERTIAPVLDHHPFFGVGMRGVVVAYDSAWVEALVVGGVVTALLLAITLISLAWRWWSLRRALPRSAWFVGGAVLMVAAGASVGVPVFTGNRIATLLWLLLGLLLTSRSPSKAFRDGRAGTEKRAFRALSVTLVDVPVASAYPDRLSTRRSDSSHDLLLPRNDPE
ncbi:hypothetical protein [Cellulomonas flavigena]|nr:hypothetical protein [Cellulomonas flavigena]